MALILDARNITKRFPGVLANDHVSFSLNEGEILAFLGENGAGKSTLMQILYGLYQRDEGEILIKGQPVSIHSPSDAIAQGIGMIHQDFMLIPRFSVVENVVMGLNEAGSGPLLDLYQAAQRLAGLSEQYGLQVDPWARVEQLSVGVQQRVEILKLLYRDARLLILDEPSAVLTPMMVRGSPGADTSPDTGSPASILKFGLSRMWSIRLRSESDFMPVGEAKPSKCLASSG